MSTDATKMHYTEFLFNANFIRLLPLRRGRQKRKQKNSLA